MRRITLIVIALASPALAAPAQAATLSGPYGSAWQGALDTFRVPTPSRAIPILDAADASNPCEGTSCMARGSIWLQGATDTSDVVTRYEFAHEIGHVFDVTNLGARGRAAFRRILHRTGSWWAGDAPLVEQFAMAYAYCAYGEPLSQAKQTYPGYDYSPTQAQHAAACRLVRSANSARLDR